MNKNNYKKIITFYGIFLVVFSALIFFAVNAFNFGTENNSEASYKQPKFSNVRIYATNDQDVNRLMNAGLFIDHANTKPGKYMDAWLSEDEMKSLQASGIPYEVLIDDWDTYYNNLPKMSESDIQKQMQELKDDYNITHSIYGTMGGYMTYDTVVSRLNQMRQEYPQFISAKWSIGTTYENRTMWAVRITKNPDAPTGRPEVMYHALIHAREPESMETQMFYFYWLFENYNTDPIARYILNNREIYWIPVLNVDGYVYNQSTNPNGGGMWRSNRHITSPGCGIVDINRNYGTYQFWNSTNNGSSTNSCDGGQGTYRGPLPFSELETQNMMNFVNSRNFNAAFGAHTYGNYLIKPWCWADPVGTPDDAKFNLILADLKSFNPVYTTGFPSQTVGYKVRGGADDWYYNDSVHAAANHHIFSITPETGLSFWPAQTEIIPLAQGMFLNNQYMSLIAGPYVAPISNTFNQATYTQGSSGNLKVKFRNKGVVNATNVKVNLVPFNSYLTVPVQQYTYASVPSFSNDSATFNFTVAANAPNNCAIPTTLTIKQDTATVYTTQLYVYIGSGTVTLNDNAEGGIGNWTTSGSWAWKTDYYNSPTHSFGYAPYSNNINYSLTLTNPINVQSAPVIYLTLWTRYDLEASYDFGYVEVSSNNGTTWQGVAAYTGTNLTWTQQSYDITQYANSSTQLKIRFRLYSDANTLGAGWWVDDIKFTNYCMGLVGVGSNPTLPKTFALEQNYPNPFNPVTSIKYQLPRAEFVTIKLFDVLGREVATLVNERKDAGFFQLEFDASNYASGLYFYKIEAGDFVETKKMMLVK